MFSRESIAFAASLVVKMFGKMTVTVTLWAKEGQEDVGVSEFVLYEPDEKRFKQRAQGLFNMVKTPYARLSAHMMACGGSRHIDVSMTSVERVSTLLWEAYRALCPEC